MKRLLLSFLLAIVFSDCAFEKGEDELCFVGDSITYLWDVEYYFPNYIVHKHAVSGAGLKQMDTWNVSDCKGRTTVLLIGTNDIGYWKTTTRDIEFLREDYKDRFIKSAKRIGADPLIVLSVLPRNFMGDEDPSVNENIEIQNGLLRDALKKEIPGSRFIDVFDLFLDDDFEIREDLFKDGLHPNDEGYEILSRQIQRAL